jgi:ADP-ribose pyrophosphatase
MDEIKKYMDQLKIITRTSPMITNGTFLKIATSDYTLSNNKTITREEIIKKQNNAIVVLPITSEGNAVLVVQPRPLTKEGVTIELPAGYVDEGEMPIEAAYRELMEETGYSSNELQLLGSFYQDQGCSRSVNHLYLATGCTKMSDQDLDKDEYIICFECNLEELYELIFQGLIKSANCVLTSKLAELEAKEYVKSIKVRRKRYVKY